MSQLPSEFYWASDPDPKELVLHCKVIRDAFQDLQVQSGITDKAYRNWRLYLGINEKGQSGRVVHDSRLEIARIFINHLRANTRIILQYTVSQDPTWACQAANDTPDAEQAVKTAERLCNYYWEQDRVAECSRTVAEYAMIFRSAWLLREWDETAGKEIDVIDEQKKLLRYEGGLRFGALTPWQVVIDPYLASPRDLKWVIYGEPVNKWDLSEIYWDRRKEIRDLSFPRWDKFYGMESGFVDAMVHHDLIWRWTLVHLPTPACPAGRFLRFVGDEIPLVEGACPAYYTRGNNGKGRLPLHRLVHSETPGAIISGHTPVDDGAPIQEALNSQASTILSNHAKFGQLKFHGRYGDSVNLMDLPYADLIQTEGELDIMAIPGCPELIVQMKEYIAQLGGVMGVAEASRGIAPSNETAALSLALQDSSTVTNNRGFDVNYRTMLQDVASGIIEILQTVVDEERSISVLGDNDRSELVTFTRDSLKPVTGVLVRPASPMLRLNSGRIGFLEGIISKFPQLVSNESEILTALETGNFRGVFKSRDNQLAQAKGENERMRAGEKIVPEAHEHHVLHMQTHTEDVSGPKARSDPQYKVTMNTHITGHIQQISNPAVQGLMILLGYMKPEELQAYQLALGIASGMPLGGVAPPGGAPPPPGAPPGGPQGDQPGNMDNAQEKLGEAGEMLKQGAANSPMQEAAMP